MRFVLLAVGVLSVGGCAKHGIDGVKEMRARACAGDAAGFFNHVDRKELLRSTVAEKEKRAEAAFAKLDPAARAAAREKFQKRTIPDLPTAVDDVFTQWQNDIKQGPASDLCHLSVVGSSERGDTADVHVRTPAAGDHQWGLAREGNRWVLVRIGD